jgi:hypothetical protein
MTRKKTHKLKAFGDVSAVFARAKSLSAVARTLGVNRSTVHRWITTGKVVRPAQRRSLDINASDAKPTEQQTPAAWARKVRRRYELTPTEQVLVGLAEQALEVAHDATQRPETRLTAMGRYQQLVKQIDLEVESDGKVETPGDARPWPRQVG